jgi:hypothetical protein
MEKKPVHCDPQADRAMQAAPRRQARRSPCTALLAAVFELAENKAELLRHGERAWASVTFSGARHEIVLCFSGAAAVAAGEALIDALPDHEFAIPGQLVADATVISVEHTALPEPRLVVETQFLLLEEV